MILTFRVCQRHAREGVPFILHRHNLHGYAAGSALGDKGRTQGIDLDNRAGQMLLR